MVPENHHSQTRRQELKQAPDHCPRCGGGFACGAAGPAPCACTALTLSAALQVDLRARYAGCLCMACLRELAARDSVP